MKASVLGDPSTPFGERVRHRLRTELVIWFTTVGADGTPQPNPVWFLWDEGDSVLVYNRRDAHRLAHVEQRPRVSLHFDGNGRGGDIVVFRGEARLSDAEPPPHALPAYRDKYEQHMLRVRASLEAFSDAYPVALRVQIGGVRGF